MSFFLQRICEIKTHLYERFGENCEKITTYTKGSGKMAPLGEIFTLDTVTNRCLKGGNRCLIASV